jgi:hypothetical protein
MELTKRHPQLFVDVDQLAAMYGDECAKIEND